MEFNGTFLATIITFVVFVFVMNKILYKPVLAIMEERNNFVASNYKNAEENKAKTVEINEEMDEKLETAKDNARIEYIKSVNNFKKIRDEKLSEVITETNEEYKRSEESLKQLSDEVKNGLKGAMSDLADDITEKILGYRTNIQDINEEKVNSVLWGEGE